LVEEALRIFRATRADFADCLIGVLNRRAGCATTYTFDRRAAETADFAPVL
jgi:predicted nucleic-acid-binding protein